MMVIADTQRGQSEPHDGRRDAPRWAPLRLLHLRDRAHVLHQRRPRLLAPRL